MTGGFGLSISKTTSTVSLPALESSRIFPEVRFISECCAEVDGARVPTQDLYIAYCKFCENNNFRMDSFISFSIRISNYLSDFTKTKVSLQGQKLHVYEGLALR